MCFICYRSIAFTLIPFFSRFNFIWHSHDRQSLYLLQSIVQYMNTKQHCDPKAAKGLYEPRCEKSGLRGFRPGPTQTGLYSYTRWLETRNFGFR